MGKRIVSLALVAGLSCLILRTGGVSHAQEKNPCT